MTDVSHNVQTTNLVTLNVSHITCIEFGYMMYKNDYFCSLY